MSDWPTDFSRYVIVDRVGMTIQKAENVVHSAGTAKSSLVAYWRNSNSGTA